MENLPSAEQYEHSYMHRDTVTHVAVARQSDFIITGSSDGHVKFWKKMLKDIEFVKHYQVRVTYKRHLKRGNQILYYSNITNYNTYYQ